MNRLQATLAAVFATWVSMVHAHLNADRLQPEDSKSANAGCQSSNVSTQFCSVARSSLDPSQLTSDKLVMLGNAAMVSTPRNMNRVHQRQSEMRMTGQTGAAAPVPPPSSGASSGGGGTVSTETTGGEVPLLLDFGIFLCVLGDRDKADPKSFALGFVQHATLFTLGADYRLTANFMRGAALGRRNTRSMIDTSDGVTTGGSIDSRSNGPTLYGSWFPTANLCAEAMVDFGHCSHITRRDTPVLSDVVLGDASSRKRAFSLLLGYALAQVRWNYGPHARVRYRQVELDGYTEQANPSKSNRIVAPQSFNSLVTALGAQVSYALSQLWGVLMPNARIELNHQSRQNKTRDIVASFAAAKDPVPINIATTPVNRNYFNLDRGLAAHFGAGRSGTINYSATGGRAGRATHALTAELRPDFR